MTPEFLLQLIIAAGAPIAVYVGIRVDQAEIRASAEQAVKDAEKANERLDEHINQHLRGVR